MPVLDREHTIKLFVRHFIQKDKRDRCTLELTDPKKRNKFTQRLNHQWEAVLQTRFLSAIDKRADAADSIERLLGFKDDEPCYVISDYSAFDDRFMRFSEIFPVIHGAGLGTILVNLNGDRLFLETEQVKGPAARFVGIGNGGRE